MADPLFVLSILYHTLIMHSLIFTLAILCSILCVFAWSAHLTTRTSTNENRAAMWIVILATAVLWGIYHYMAH